MKSDLYEYFNRKEETVEKEHIYFDEVRIVDLLRIHTESSGSDAHWSYHKFGKSPNAFKSSSLQDNQVGQESFAITDFEEFFKEFKEDDFEEISGYE